MATIPSGRPINLPPPRMGTGDGGDWTPPTEGWHRLSMKVVRDENGEAMVRDKTFQGKVFPGKYEIRLEFTVLDGEGTWREWYGWTLEGEKSKLRRVVMAIRKNKPLDPKNFDILHYEDKPFQGKIFVNEKPGREDPSRTFYYPNIMAAKPIGEAIEDDPPAPPPVNLPNPFDDDGADF